jgi:hypothetical protein
MQDQAPSRSESLHTLAGALVGAVLAISALAVGACRESDEASAGGRDGGELTIAQTLQPDYFND